MVLFSGRSGNEKRMRTRDARWVVSAVAVVGVWLLVVSLRRVNESGVVGVVGDELFGAGGCGLGLGLYGRGGGVVVEKGAEELARRRLGEEEGGKWRFEVDDELCGGEEGRFDCFGYVLDEEKGTVTVKGSTGSALTRALGTFYRDVCGVEVVAWASRGGGRKGGGCVERAMVALGEEKTVPCTMEVCFAKVGVRYYLNQVTWSYSMAWWGWTRWEEELDWMALRGINLALAHTGQESIWRKVWRKVLQDPNYSGNEFFTSPAYLSWQRMGNLQGLGSPLSDEWMENQLELQHRILERMGALGINPILPAFNLHVPKELAKRREYTADKSSYWSGFFNEYSGVNRLSPMDPLVAKISRLFVSEQLFEYQKELSLFPTHYYSMDIFNEMDPGETDVHAAFSSVFSPVLSCDDKTVSVVQMWCFAHNPEDWTPRRMSEFIEAVPSDRVLYLDLHGEKRPQWRKRRSILKDEQLVWVYLHNFGGNKGMAGELAVIDKEINAALSKSKHVVGLGLAMEGIEQNEMVYDFVLAKAWVELVDSSTRGFLTNWLDRWILARYALSTERDHPAIRSLAQAWRCAAATVYNRPPALIGWGNTKSIVELRPTFRMEYAGFQPTKPGYDTQDFIECAKSMYSGVQAVLKEISEGTNSVLTNNEVLGYDLIDMVRQVVSDRMLELSQRLTNAHSLGDLEKVDAIGVRIIESLHLLGELLSQHWMWQFSMDDVDFGLINDEQFRDFRTLFTFWSEHTTALHSYSTRFSADLLLGLYIARWEAWLRFLTDKGSFALAKVTLLETYSDLEREWINSPIEKEMRKGFFSLPEIFSISHRIMASLEINLHGETRSLSMEKP